MDTILIFKTKLSWLFVDKELIRFIIVQIWFRRVVIWLFVSNGRKANVSEVIFHYFGWIQQTVSPDHAIPWSFFIQESD